MDKYKTLEEYYTDLQISFCSQIPATFHPTLLDTLSFQVLVERSFGGEYLSIERMQVNKISDVLDKYPHIILLGDPGCGKSITLWKLALDYAQKAIEHIDTLYPIFIELGQFDASSQFYNWLLSEGEKIPNFGQYLNSGSLVFLLDGLNEMPKSKYSENIQFLKKFMSDYPDCKFVITCRRLDYIDSIGLQQVEVEPLNQESILLFISNYIKNEKDAAQLYELLKSDVALMELASTAINLKLIISLYALVGENFPRNRSMLINGFTGALYEREKNKLISVIITETEIRSFLEKLAFAIHTEVGKGTYVNIDWVFQHFKSEGKNTKIAITPLLSLARNMGLLEIKKSILRFQHQLIQEYFAALELGKRLVDDESKKHFWVAKSKNSNNHLETLFYPMTGWEEVTIMLSGTKENVKEFVENISEYNPMLAARCISEGMVKVQVETCNLISRKLLHLIEASDSSLSTRIHSGMLIGELNDPRFYKKTLSENYVIFPKMIQIPAGIYSIGSDKTEISDSYLDETPKHLVTIKLFSIGLFPVTNAEFNCFIKDAGYKKQEYWTNEGWAWKQGKLTTDLKQWILEGYRNVRNQVLQEKDRLELTRTKDSDEMDVWWNILMEWSNDKVEFELEKLFEERNACLHNRLVL